MGITLYIAVFVKEKNVTEEEDGEGEEMTILPSQIFSIMKDILRNKHLLIYIAFLCITYAPCTFD